MSGRKEVSVPNFLGPSSPEPRLYSNPLSPTTRSHRPPRRGGPGPGCRPGPGHPAAGRVISSSAWLGSATPRRVVVRQDHRRGVARQRLLDDLPGMHAGAVDRAAEQLRRTRSADGDCPGTGSRRPRVRGPAAGPAGSRASLAGWSAAGQPASALRNVAGTVRSRPAGSRTWPIPGQGYGRPPAAPPTASRATT